MRRNLYGSALALTLACSMILSACGGSSSSSTTTTSAATTTAAAETTKAAETEAPVETEAPAADLVDTGRPGYDYIANNVPKLSDKLVTFRVAVSLQAMQDDFNNMSFFEELEKATNVHIEFDCYPNANYTDQKNLMLATGDYPDAFLGYYTLTMSDLNQYGPLGVFIPVEDLIEKYGTNYKKVLEQTPALDGLSNAFDGHKYSWGTINDSPTRDYPDNLYINKQWLDNLGLEIPTTMEEYYDVLKAFKEQDANGNGDPNDEIPYTFIPLHHINSYGSFFGAYGEAEAFNNGKTEAANHFVVVDDEIVYLPITEEYKTAIKELRKFVVDGLWDLDGFVQASDQYLGKLANPEGIVGSVYTWDTANFAVETADQYIAIKPLKATADSEDAKVHHRQNHISIQPTGFSITDKCSDPDILAQWVDLFYDDIMTILGYYGIDRITDISEDGIVSYDESPSADGTQFETFVKNSSPYDNVPKNMTTEIRYEKMHLETIVDKKVNVAAEFYQNAPQSLTLPTMNYTVEENEFVSDYGLACQSYVETKQSEWLLGRADIDEEWDAYLAQLETLRLQEFIDLTQAVYDRTIGK